MIKLFRKKDNGYLDTLRAAFPKQLSHDLDIVFSILPLSNHSITLHDGKTYKVDNLIHTEKVSILVRGEELSIPCRLYFDEPEADLEVQLTETQKTILNCIYLRHWNGYIRQKRLEQLSDTNEYWTIPFTIHLLGEYVFEIIEVLDPKINESSLPQYAKFVIENPKYWQSTESRMISYWNEYYRHPKFPKLKEYLGYQIAKRIKYATHNIN